MRKERGDERGGEGRKKRGRGGRESWINVLVLTCPSTGGDRGTANSVGSCSRQAAASLSSAQRSASFASELRTRAFGKDRSPEQNNKREAYAECSLPTLAGYAITSVPLKPLRRLASPRVASVVAGLVIPGQRKFSPVRTWLD